MTQIAQPRKSSLRHLTRRNAAPARQTKPASKHDQQQGALIAPTVLADQNDAALAAVDSGADEAFEILVRRHQARILSVAWRFTHNREDAEDISQQTFHKAFVHLRQFKGNSSFSTWLTRIAINEALMWSRRKRASSERSPDVLNANSETATRLDPTDLAQNPEEACLHLERKRIVATAIDNLTPKIRTAVQLRQLSELSIRETAGLMGLSIGTVKARLFHGRSKLRAMLKRYVGSDQLLRPIHRTDGNATGQLVCACE